MMSDHSEERWLPVVGCEGRYDVSSRGRVRSLQNNWGHKRIKMMSLVLGRAGYPFVVLMVNKVRRQPNVHRLVAESFIGPIPDGMQVNHKNGIKSDNWIENLEIVTPSENALHSVRVLGNKTGYQAGEKHPNALLTDKQYDEACALILEGKLLDREIAELFGVSRNVVKRLKNLRLGIRRRLSKCRQM